MIAIIGGGVIGLTVALELAHRGEDVCVYERGECGTGASWAAAGMLAPYTEEPESAPMRSLCARSLQMYPAFAAQLRDYGPDVHLQCAGILSLAFDDVDELKLRRRGEQLEREGIRATWLAPREVLSLEPVVRSGVRGGLLVHDEGHVDNRRLGRALRAACASAGVRVREQTGNVSVEMDSRRVLGLRTNEGYAPADAVVNCAGAHADRIAGVAPECVPPLRSVKGQIVELGVADGLMRHAVWVPGAYLVPRVSGRLIIGATVEAADDERVTSGGIASLLDAANASAPALRDFAITDMWAGVRPGTPDGMPVLGTTARNGYFVATGHYRNGILLAPLTGALIADAVQNKQTPELEPFSIGRFSSVHAQRFDAIGAAR